MIGFQVTVENVGDVFFGDTVYYYNYYYFWHLLDWSNYSS